MALPNYAKMFPNKVGSVPAGVNPSAWAFQQSKLNNAANISGGTPMTATGNPADNAAATAALRNASASAYKVYLSQHPELTDWWKGDPRYDSSVRPGPQVGAIDLAGPGEQPRYSTSPLVQANMGKQQPFPGVWINDNGQVSYDPSIPNASANASLYLSKIPQPKANIGGIAGAGEPFVPLSAQGNIQGYQNSYAAPTIGNMGGAGPTPIVPETPAASIPAASKLPAVSVRQERDPVGSLYDAFQRSLSRATMPPQFRATWS